MKLNKLILIPSNLWCLGIMRIVLFSLYSGIFGSYELQKVESSSWRLNNALRLSFSPFLLQTLIQYITFPRYLWLQQQCIILVMRLWHAYRNDLQTAMTLKLSWVMTILGLCYPKMVYMFNLVFLYREICSHFRDR